jgi:hypothetical protein
MQLKIRRLKNVKRTNPRRENEKSRAPHVLGKKDSDGSSTQHNFTLLWVAPSFYFNIIITSMVEGDLG